MTAPRRLTTVLMDWREAGPSAPAGVEGWEPDERVVESWACALAGADASADLVRVVVGSGRRSPELHRTAPVSTLLVGGERWWLDAVEALGLADTDLLLVSEATSSPSPLAVSRLLAAYGGPGELVDARVLPTEVRAMLSEAEEDTLEPPLPEVGPYQVSGALVLLDAGTFRTLGQAWTSSPQDGAGERLEELLEVAGARVVPAPTATVFRRVRVDQEGHPLRLDAPLPELDEVPPPRTSGSLHPAVLPATSLSSFLGAIGMRPSATEADASDAEQRPFLSIVTRTQGLRPHTLEDVLTCLAAQTDRDFELLLMCHRAAPEAVAATRGVIAEFPAWLRERVRVLEVSRPGRSAPLNDGFQAARGRYLVMLDDDDTVLEHWVETFHRAESEAEGMLLRSVALLQPVRTDPSTDEFLPRAVAPARREWPLRYEMIDHLRANYSPCMTIAFPRGIFHSLSLRFDETLNTTEDWDLIVRSAGVVGVHSVPEITTVYRWWGAGSSRDEHDKAEWDEAMHRVLDKFDQVEMLMPPHAFERFRAILTSTQHDATKMNDQARELATVLHHTNLQLTEVAEDRDRMRDKAQRLSEKLQRRAERQQQRLDLLRQVDLLLLDRPADRPEGSIVDLTPRELEQLVARLSEQPARRGWRLGR
ncbi:glycosyltransferase family 2 protein [Nocardioides campestrisoli]|uniref:glycosyltransferase family 2 protein n=1 Tax=Nocardioides campestrisoli TaxID=2736757 RepID=UPI00163DA605|nr:glycosyltransferase family A protein [Nocardioides campestrisoli]